MEVEVISTQFIKPFCPTAKHLKSHKLSLLDQFVPSIYVPMVLFYAADQCTQSIADSDIIPQRLQLLRQSLSETLTHFYPFAGRIKDKLSIDCNDEGVYYNEAKVNSSLIEFFNQPNLSSLILNFLPSNPSWQEASERAHVEVAMVQVTSFACGGVAVGALVSHMVADGAATAFFLNSWGTTARQASHIVFPNFDALPTIFPQNDVLPKDANVMALVRPFLKKGKRVTRRLGFGGTDIANLRAKASSLSVQVPTRVEAVSALISKCTMAAFKANSGLEKPSLVAHVVNMRRRAVPDFPQSYMGNFLWFATTLSSDEKGEELPNLVTKLREAITKINADFVKSLEGEEGHIRYREVLKETVVANSSTAAMLSSAGHGMDYIGYASWCKFGFYDIDFGWGKPTWAACTGSKDAETIFANAVVLMDTPSGDGIEAWVYLREDDMTLFEKDKDLLAFATVDPNPLQLNSSISKSLSMVNDLRRFG